VKYLLSLFIALVATHSIAAQPPALPKSASGHVFTTAEVDMVPKFPGGESAYYKFLSRNLQWPKDAPDDIQGRVIISFIIEKNGQLSNFKIERGIEKHCDAEAIHLVKKIPRFIPGKKSGKSVRDKYFVVIPFELSD
jgi:protein TonB